MLCSWRKIAFHVPRSICHLGLFQGEGVSISSHLQVIVTVEQFAECVWVLWRCGTFQGFPQYTYVYHIIYRRQILALSKIVKD